jgi:hypothetical protein
MRRREQRGNCWRHLLCCFTSENVPSPSLRVPWFDEAVEMAKYPCVPAMRRAGGLIVFTACGGRSQENLLCGEGQI